MALMTVSAMYFFFTLTSTCLGGLELLVFSFKDSKSKIFNLLIIIIIIIGFFLYGIGVGKYSWPPHDVIQGAYDSIVSLFKESKKLKAGPYIVITFDDGKETDYTVAYELMEVRNIKGTSYITTSWIGKDGYLSWVQVKELMQAGWTIGCHTHTHPRLTALVDEDIHFELKNVDLSFAKHGLSAPLHHAYPFGDYNDRVINVINQYRKTARSIKENFVTVDLYNIPVLPIYIQDDDYFEEVKNQIDNAMENDLIVVLLTHDVKDNPSIYGTKTRYFEKLVDYIFINNFPTATMADIYEIIQAHESE